MRCSICSRRLPSGPCPLHGWTEPSTAIPRPEGHDRRPEVQGLTISESIGAGGFAVVWAGVREADGAPVTVKVSFIHSDVVALRFTREAEALRSIGPPWTPRYHAHGLLGDGRPYIVMERLFGATLGQHLGELGAPLPAAEAARLADAVAASLQIAHDRGLVHRDLKPENIFLADGGRRVALLDFGLTRRFADAEQTGLTRSGVAMGTPEYMAPEQLDNARDAGPAADVYAIGVILFELLTLRLPFSGDLRSVERGHLTLRPPRPSAWVEIAPGLEEIVLRCLAKEPEQRPSIAALRRALGDALAAPPSAPAVRRPAASAAAPDRSAGEGQQPAVIVVIDHAGEASAVMAAIADRQGLLARQKAERYVAVFAGLTADAPARAALDAAHEVVERHGARAAIHLANVTMRRRAGGALGAFGAALERPETWLPAEPWSGVTRTAALDEVLPEEAAPASPVSALRAGEPSIATSASELLVGRDAERDVLRESARAALVEGRSGLVTILGEAGTGKSRLAAEAVAAAREASLGVLAVPLHAPVASSGSSLAHTLLGALGQRDAASPIEGAPHHEKVLALSGALARRAAEGPVAVVLDDAHRADAAVLDALEYASLDAALPLWVVVVATPRLLGARPGWGERNRHQARVTLGALAREASMQLAAELLHPAEYPPEAVLDQLARWSGGNPSSLAEVVRALKRAGLVRRHAGAQGFYVATADLDALPVSPAWQWLATRRLSTLAPELSALGRLAAPLGPFFERDEVEAVIEALEQGGQATTPVDVGVGLATLGEEGFLERGEGGRRWSFRSAQLQGALEEMVEPALQASIHRAALGFWRARPASDAGEAERAWRAIGRHAAACGEGAQAADAYLKLGDLAFAGHRHVEADQRYTAALEAAGDDDAPRRAAALGGRGRCRYLIGREREAQEDLAAAGRAAVEIGDRRLAAELLLEEATALDWGREFDASSARIEAARPLVEALGDARLDLKLLVADGRTAWRRDQIPASIALLDQALTRAEAIGDYPCRVITRLILSFEIGTLPSTTATEETARRAGALFDEVLALTREAEDWPHLFATYGNRSMYWHYRKDPDRALADLHVAVDLARRVGSPVNERVATFNLVYILHGANRSEEALPLARRACFLEERFVSQPQATAKLYLARVLLMLDQRAEARELLAAIDASQPADMVEASEVAAYLRVYHRMLGLVLDAAPEDDPAWGALITDAGRRDEDLLLEVLYWFARCAVQARGAAGAASALARAREASASHPGWRARVEALAEAPA